MALQVDAGSSFLNVLIPTLVKLNDGSRRTKFSNATKLAHLFEDEKDLPAPPFEVLISEILCVKYEIEQLLKNIQSWTKPRPMSESRLFHRDKCVEVLLALGTVLIISSWSSPFQNIMIPLAGAIAAGNCVIIKPAELAVATTQLFVEQIPKYFNRSVCQVLTGTFEETKDFLKEHNCDFVYFTGASDDGIFIMREAAKTLTPVYLNLYGKCPVYVDSSVDIVLAAKRVMWGKIFNCGQMVAAPDYVLCHADVQPKFLKECRYALELFYGGIPKIDTKGYGRIISVEHTERLREMIFETEGKLVLGGFVNARDKFVQPTVFCDVPEYDILMQHEIFGPILPVITVNSSDDAMEYVSNRRKPQAIYVFSSKKSVFQTWKKHTESDSIMHNDVVMLKGTRKTFGGIEASGFARCRGKSSIELFSRYRGVIKRSKKDDNDCKMRYPPPHRTNPTQP
ncbi:Aldehyde dehydrogenase family 3 member B1 [Taenia crassiceps]|uniref:Aldehyde dehydrogenase n=1 Tax=Taenia crassiceps TaxID=6207 RepID=A0ABR4Q5S1_9CEST